MPVQVVVEKDPGQIAFIRFRAHQPIAIGKGAIPADVGTANGQPIAQAIEIVGRHESRGIGHHQRRGAAIGNGGDVSDRIGAVGKEMGAVAVTHQHHAIRTNDFENINAVGGQDVLETTGPDASVRGGIG